MNKKGFTLVELLVVIIILAILVLLALPRVLTFMERSRVSSFVVEANGVIKAARSAHGNSELDEEEILYPVCYTVAELVDQGYLDKDKNELKGAIVIDMDNGDKEKVYTYLSKQDYYIRKNDPSGKSAVVNSDVTKRKGAPLFKDCTVSCSATGGGLSIKCGDTELTGEVSNEDTPEVACDFVNGNIWEFEYTGDIQSFEVPCDGKYKLEVWGAQGGSGGVDDNDYTSGSKTPGKGGYSMGYIDLTSDLSLNVVVGGKGATAARGKGVNGGYNGGGRGAIGNRDTSAGSGGGATHIAKSGDDYTTLASYGDAITAANYMLIAAGGGGGACPYGANTSGTGGSGGGVTGGSGNSSAAWGRTTGGSQTSAGTGSANGAFGQGANSAGGNGGGGGGGWYGGGAGIGGSGGSGYVTGLEDTATSNGVQSGNGKARITLIKADSSALPACDATSEGNKWTFKYTGSVGYWAIPCSGLYEITVKGGLGGVDTYVFESGGHCLGNSNSGCSQKYIASGKVVAQYNLNAGEVIKYIIGGQGGSGRHGDCGSEFGSGGPGWNGGVAGGGGGSGGHSDLYINNTLILEARGGDSNRIGYGCFDQGSHVSGGGSNIINTQYAGFVSTKINNTKYDETAANITFELITIK